MYWLILEKEEGSRERESCCSICLCIHWLILVCALTGDWTCKIGILGWCSLARVNCLHLIFSWLPITICNLLLKFHVFDKLEFLIKRWAFRNEEFLWYYSEPHIETEVAKLVVHTCFPFIFWIKACIPYMY